MKDFSAYKLGHPARVAAGNEHLVPADPVEQIVLPSGVKLAHNVVQKDHRIFPGHPFEHHRFPDFEGDGATPLLTLRTVGAGGDAVDRNIEVVPVDAHPGKTHPNILFEVLRKLFPVKRDQFLRVGFQRNAFWKDRGFISERKGFLIAGKPAVHLFRQSRELEQIVLPENGNRRSNFGKLLVPYREKLFPRFWVRPEPAIFQERVSLFKDPIVLGKVAGVDRLDLADGNVEEGAPFGRPVLDQRKILRMEHDAGKLAV